APFALPPTVVCGAVCRTLADAPRQASEGAPPAAVVLDPRYAAALHGVEPGDVLVLVTWLDRADRDVLQVHPRDEAWRPLTGVFATRSSDRPNPIGLHPVRGTAVEKPATLRVAALEAVDGTPVLDVKVALS